MTVVSFATSSLELLVSLQAVLDRSSYIAFGNLIGSNIFNILAVLGGYYNYKRNQYNCC